MSTDRDPGHPATAPGAPADKRRERGFRLGDATPSSRFLLVLVAASLLLAVALARAAEGVSHFPQ